MTVDIALVDNAGGHMATGAQLLLHAQSLDNRAGSIAALGDAEAAVGGDFGNADGVLRSAGQLRLGVGGTLHNDHGVIEGEQGIVPLNATNNEPVRAFSSRSLSAAPSAVHQQPTDAGRDWPASPVCRHALAGRPAQFQH